MEFPLSDTEALQKIKDSVPYVRFMDIPDITEGQAYTRFVWLIESINTVEKSLEELRALRVRYNKEIFNNPMQ